MAPAVKSELPASRESARSAFSEGLSYSQLGRQTPNECIGVESQGGRIWANCDGPALTTRARYEVRPFCPR
jgi:hypothetical protein